LLPSHGIAYSVLLLASAAQLAPRLTIDEWVQAARYHGSHLAAATNLANPASDLLDCNLATLGHSIEVSPRLIGLLDAPSTSVLRDIAQLIFIASPPVWLPLVVSEHGVDRELIPEKHLHSLLWLEPLLDEMLQLAWRQASSSTILDQAKQIGDAGELFVLASLRNAGWSASHVAKLSDAFGYDIEVYRPYPQKIEVKAAGPNTDGGFHLSRNEFTTCLAHRNEWRLVQVTFNSAAFITKQLNISHVACVKEIDAWAIIPLVPPDTEHFSWQESAKLRPPAGSWRSWCLPLDRSLTIPGFA
jgi:hypothetical protein